MLAVIKKTWREVAFLLVISGGFWFALEPPVFNPTGTLTGFVGAVSVAAALGIRSVLEHWRQSRHVRLVIIGAALAFLTATIPAFWVYVSSHSKHVTDYELNGTTIQLIKGMEYRPEILPLTLNPVNTDQVLLDRADGQRESIWTPESIYEAERILTIWYVLTQLSTLLATIFAVEFLRNSRPTENAN